MEEQAHSSYASGVFQKIMTEILPYKNIFPVTDPEDEPGTQDHALPEREGITDNTQSELTPETKVYETDEYVEPTEEDRGVPAQLPEGVGTLEEEPESSSEESQEQEEESGGQTPESSGSA